MAQTPLSTTAAYCSAADLFVYHDWEQVADFLKAGQAPRPSKADLLNSSSEAGAALARYLLLGAGRIESMCLIGRRYSPEDLQALHATATASREALVKLNADLAFWYCAQRRQPGTADPKAVPGALEAAELLKALRDGEAVFGFEETADAGLPDVIQAVPSRLLTPNTVARARRIFPLSYPNILDANGD